MKRTFALALIAAASLPQPTRAHCYPAPNVQCVDAPCHHPDSPECRAQQQAGKAVQSLGGAVAQEVLPGLIIIPKLKTPLNPPDETPETGTSIRPSEVRAAARLINESLALPPSAIPTEVTRDAQLEAVEVGIVNATRELSQAGAVAAVLQKHPRAGANTIVRSTYRKLRVNLKELEAYNRVVQRAAVTARAASSDDLRDTKLERARWLLESIIDTAGEKQ
jgi:hypothetical protein